MKENTSRAAVHLSSVCIVWNCTLAHATYWQLFLIYDVVQTVFRHHLGAYY